jgi:hypothetical protein
MHIDIVRTLRRWYTVEFVLTTTFCPSTPTDPEPIFRHRSSPSSSSPCFRMSTWGSSASILISDSRRNVRSRRMQRQTRFSKQHAFSSTADNDSTACTRKLKISDAEKRHTRTRELAGPTDLCCGSSHKLACGQLINQGQTTKDEWKNPQAKHVERCAHTMCACTRYSVKKQSPSAEWKEYGYARSASPARMLSVYSLRMSMTQINAISRARVKRRNQEHFTYARM